MKNTGISILIIAVIGVGYWLISPAFITTTVDESLPEELMPVVEQLMIQAPEEMRHVFKEEMMEMANQEHVVEETMEPAKGPTPELPRVGNFIDVAHHGSGLAKLFTTADGGLLRLEDLDVLNGPDLRVLLSPNIGVERSGDLGDYVEIGKLKGNKGNQNYTIPADLNINDFNSVIIYCKPFHVVFNSANLK